MSRRRAPRRSRRSRRRGFWRGRPLWLKGLTGALIVLCAFNLTVAWVGETSIFPLSPYFLKSRAEALGQYVQHRVGCLGRGHEELDAAIGRATATHRLPPGLLKALVLTESEGRPHRISAAGAMGPGQLMPGTARLLGVSDAFDPEEAIDGSARYLARQLRRYRGNVPLALAAYNAGPGNVGTVVPRNGETEFYVRKVMRAWKREGASARSAAGTAGIRR